MSRRIAPLLACLVLISSNAVAQGSAESSFAPLYEGPHVLPVLTLPRPPADWQWSNNFQQDTNIVLWKYGWYLAEVICLVDETGQARETIITEALPSLNLSATMVDEFRRHKFVAGTGPNGPVASLFPFRIRYAVPNQVGDLGSKASQLRAKASAGNASAQYTMSRLMLAGNVTINTTGFDADELVRSAAAGGSYRAMLALAVPSSKVLDGKNAVSAAAERRGWLLKAAQTGSSPAQVLVALEAWAEQTAEGHARARHWLELATKAKDLVAQKYLAALFVSHSESPEDWKAARELASTVSREWRGRNDPDAWQVLAATLALTGDFKGAEKAQSKASALAVDLKWPVDAIERRLASYKESRTVREEIVLIPAVARAILPSAKETNTD